MEKNSNQKINCTVSSCRYNNEDKNACELNKILVQPCTNCDTGTPEESMCGSYKVKVYY